MVILSIDINHCQRQTKNWWRMALLWTAHRSEWRVGSVLYPISFFMAK